MANHFLCSCVCDCVCDKDHESAIIIISTINITTLKLFNESKLKIVVMTNIQLVKDT